MHREYQLHPAASFGEKSPSAVSGVHSSGPGQNLVVDGGFVV